MADQQVHDLLMRAGDLVEAGWCQGRFSIEVVAGYSKAAETALEEK